MSESLSLSFPPVHHHRFLASSSRSSSSRPRQPARAAESGSSAFTFCGSTSAAAFVGNDTSYGCYVERLRGRDASALALDSISESSEVNRDSLFLYLPVSFSLVTITLSLALSPGECCVARRTQCRASFFFSSIVCLDEIANDAL